jgi:hypothetical protein
MRQIKSAALVRVPPGQQKIGNDPALPCVTLGDFDQTVQSVSLRLRDHLRHPFSTSAISDINTISDIIYSLYPSWLAGTVKFDQSGQTGVGVGKVHRNLQERRPNLLRHSHIHLDFSFPTKFSAVDFFCIATAGKALLPSLGNALPFLFRGDRRRSLRFEGT